MVSWKQNADSLELYGSKVIFLGYEFFAPGSILDDVPICYEAKCHPG